jgi:hypothetical protein
LEFDHGLRRRMWDYDPNQQMKFNKLTLEMFRIDLISQSTQNLDKKITFVAFNLRGTAISYMA